MSITKHFISTNYHPLVQVIFIYVSYFLYVLYCIIIVHVEKLYVDTYLYIEQHICYALDTLYIIHLYLILLQIFSNSQTNFSIHFLFSIPFFGSG
jgi:hypothetical protein